MNLHEYQAKEIFRQYKIPVPRGRVARSPEEAEAAARALGAENFAVKAQIHAGGRGKAGGVKIVRGPAEVRAAAQALLGQFLKTIQTGPLGQPVDQILVEVKSPISKEFYAGIVLDRFRAQPCFIFSESGGMEIEEVAKKSPERIRRKNFSACSGLSLSEAKSFLAKGGAPLVGARAGTQRSTGFATGFASATDGSAAPQARPAPTISDVDSLAQILVNLAKVFLETDAGLVEVNPLAQLQSGEWLALDAKIRLDDNGLERHPELARLNDPRQEDPRETEAKKFGLSYVGLDGNIGCMVNGAGLAMATMDLIKLAGGEPANFLDVGGGAGTEKVTAAFKIILTDSKVRAILVNIFGGIMRCDVVAEGILAAVKEIETGAGTRRAVPLLVVRLEGTQVKEGKEILRKSGLKIISAESLQEAAEKVVSSVHPR